MNQDLQDKLYNQAAQFDQEAMWQKVKPRRRNRKIFLFLSVGIALLLGVFLATSYLQNSNSEVWETTLTDEDNQKLNTLKESVPIAQERVSNTGYPPIAPRVSLKQTTNSKQEFQNINRPRSTTSKQVVRSKFEDTSQTTTNLSNTTALMKSIDNKDSIKQSESLIQTLPPPDELSLLYPHLKWNNIQVAKSIDKYQSRVYEQWKKHIQKTQMMNRTQGLSLQLGYVNNNKSNTTLHTSLPSFLSNLSYYKTLDRFRFNAGVEYQLIRSHFHLKESIAISEETEGVTEVITYADGSVSEMESTFQQLNTYHYDISHVNTLQSIGPSISIAYILPIGNTLSCAGSIAAYFPLFTHQNELTLIDSRIVAFSDWQHPSQGRTIQDIIWRPSLQLTSKLKEVEYELSFGMQASIHSGSVYQQSWFTSFGINYQIR